MKYVVYFPHYIAYSEALEKWNCYPTKLNEVNVRTTYALATKLRPVTDAIAARLADENDFTYYLVSKPYDYSDTACEFSSIEEATEAWEASIAETHCPY